VLASTFRMEIGQLESSLLGGDVVRMVKDLMKRTHHEVLDQSFESVVGK